MEKNIQSSCFAAEFYSCISANLRLYFIYVNRKLSCKMGSDQVFLKSNLNSHVSWRYVPNTDC